MKFSIKTGQPEQQATACLILPVFSKGILSKTGQELDKITQGELSKALQGAQHTGENGRLLFLPPLKGIHAQHILLVGCGEAHSLSNYQWTQLLTKITRALQDYGISTVLSYLHEDITLLEFTVRLLISSRYRFTECKSKVEPETNTLTEFVFGLPASADLKQAGGAIIRGEAVGLAMNKAKTLGNLPANICTPTYLAEQAQQLTKTYPNIKATILEPADIKALKMGAFLAVAQGSSQPARLITLEYQGAAKEAAPIVLIGKGITFDSGGLSIKTGAGMMDMKYDMLGAATVLGTLEVAAQLKLPINIVVVIPSTENLINGQACKPSDIATSMSGQTIEILNTDAEGRLILCDALTYSERFKPKFVIDVATLTGATIIGLGLHNTGLFSNDDELANALTTAGLQSSDAVWRMPLGEEYQEQLKTPYADMANIGNGTAGSIIGACFLERFAKNLRWAHLDVAGTAMRTGPERCATGRPIPLLVQFLVNHAAN